MAWPGGGALMARRLVIAGLSGYVGRLVEAGLGGEWDIVGVGRTAADGIVSWDELPTVIDGAAAVLNLAGRRIDCRWTEDNLAEIESSRVETSTRIGQAIATAASPPACWINASGIGIFPPGDGIRDEHSLQIGATTLGRICERWEDATRAVALPATRVVQLRIGVVLGPERGGAADVLYRLARFGLGGRQGSGSQWVSWISSADLVRVIAHVLASDLAGPVHAVAPGPVTNKDFMRGWRRAVKMPIGLPAPTAMLRLVGRLKGPDASLILDSIRAVPQVLLDDGFAFTHPDWEAGAAWCADR